MSRRVLIPGGSHNALQIDLTGQVAAEAIGSVIWSGVRGQTAFSIAGLNALDPPSAFSSPATKSTGGLREGGVACARMPPIPETWAMR